MTQEMVGIDLLDSVFNRRLVDNISREKWYVLNRKSLNEIKNGDCFSFLQQHLHKVLSEETRASNDKIHLFCRHGRRRGRYRVRWALDSKAESGVSDFELPHSRFMAANLKRVDANVVETERPNKRARLSLDPEDKPSTSATVNDAMNDDADEDEESSDVKADPLRPSDLYLDTVSLNSRSECVTGYLTLLKQINRTALDFDFEKLCSVSLSNINVYGCLVCGKYFQGRGKSSYAYAHSIHEDHHVFIQLETKQVRSILRNHTSTDSVYVIK